MLDFEVQRSARRCCRTDRELKPGETFYTVLTVQGAQVIRHDYSAESWTEAPADVLAWWKSRVPDAMNKKPQWAPNDAMLHYFEQLAGDPQKQDVRYILALLMIRRRILRLEETERLTNGQDQLVLFCARNETEYRVAANMPGEARIAEIQQEIAHVLFADAA